MGRVEQGARLGALLLVLLAVGVSASPAGASHQYPDVADNDPFHDDIGWMHDLGIASGFPDGTYRPLTHVTRQSMAAFLHRFWSALGETDSPTIADPGFTDVGPDHPFYDDIAWMADLGITTGFDDGGFHPSDAVTRQSMAAFLHRFWTALDEVEPVHLPFPDFTDVPLTHPFYDDIGWMADVDLSGGYPDGTYRPTLELTREAMAAFLHRLWMNMAGVVDTGTDAPDAAPGDGRCDVDEPPAEIGDCSLRAAVTEANLHGGFDIVRVLPGVEPVVTEGTLDITDDLRLDGKGNPITGDAFRLVAVGGLTNVEIRHVTLTGSSGGAVAQTGGTLTIDNSTITGNTVTGSGGGIRQTGGDLVIVDSTLSDNQATGSGGAIYQTGGTLTIGDSTISANTATTGGGMTLGGTASLRHVTSTANVGTDGAGIVVTGGTATVAASVVADTGLDCVGAVVSAGYNLDSDGTCGFDDPTDLPTGPALVANRADNGGPTATHLPWADSPLIDAIPTTTIDLCDASTPTDQRGEARPHGSGCDIGAVEGSAAGPFVPLELVVDDDADLVDATPGDGVCATADTTCTLRAAITEANFRLGRDTITITPGIHPTLSIAGADEDANATGDLDITDDLTLEGGGATVDGDGIDRVLHIPLATVTLTDLTITDGQATEGGGVLASGWVDIVDTVLTGNTADAGAAVARGGALFVGNAGAQVTVMGCTFDHNTATGGASSSGGAARLTSGDLTIADSSLTDNTAPAGGALAQTGGTLQVTDTTIDTNTATSGGGVNVTTGTATISNSTISNNQATSAGGGANQTGGDVTFTDTTVDDNTGYLGGGLSLSGGHTTIESSSVTQNVGTFQGGGIFQDTYGTLEIHDTLIADNTSSARWGGGISQDGGAFVYSTLDITDSVITRNHALGSGANLSDGGGLLLWGDDTITSTEISDNTGRYGGGIYQNAGTLVLDSSTVSGNTATVAGGGIHRNAAADSLIIRNSTISANSAPTGGGLLLQTYSADVSKVIDSTITGNTAASGAAINVYSHVLVLTGTIIDGTGNDCAYQNSGTVVSGGYNIGSDASCGLTGTGDLPSTSALLGPLANNGGPTETHLPGVGSPAIDSIPAGVGTCDGTLPTDQRGEIRPTGTACDRGAVEQ